MTQPNATEITSSRALNPSAVAQDAAFLVERAYGRGGASLADLDQLLGAIQQLTGTVPVV